MPDDKTKKVELNKALAEIAQQVKDEELAWQICGQAKIQRILSKFQRMRDEARHDTLAKAQDALAKEEEPLKALLSLIEPEMTSDSNDPPERVEQPVHRKQKKTEATQPSRLSRQDAETP